MDRSDISCKQKSTPTVQNEKVIVLSSRPKRLRRAPAALHSYVHDLDINDSTKQLQPRKRRSRLNTNLTDDSGFEESDRNSLSTSSNHSDEDCPAGTSSSNKISNKSKCAKRFTKKCAPGKLISNTIKKSETEDSTLVEEIVNDLPACIIAEDCSEQRGTIDKMNQLSPPSARGTVKVKGSLELDMISSKNTECNKSTELCDNHANDAGVPIHRKRQASDNSSTKERMLMREWIEWNADNCTFSGLKWLDRDERLVQISWRHGSRNEWSRDDVRHFESWADYNGRRDPDSDDCKRWKANFRCALNTRSDIVEVKNHCSHTNSSREQFRIYRILDQVTKERKSKSGKREHGNDSLDVLCSAQKKSRSEATVDMFNSSDDTFVDDGMPSYVSSEINQDRNQMGMRENHSWSLPLQFHVEAYESDICTLPADDKSVGKLIRSLSDGDSYSSSIWTTLESADITTDVTNLSLFTSEVLENLNLYDIPEFEQLLTPVTDDDCDLPDSSSELMELTTVPLSPMLPVLPVLLPAPVLPRCVEEINSTDDIRESLCRVY